MILSDVRFFKVSVRLTTQKWIIECGSSSEFVTQFPGRSDPTLWLIRGNRSDFSKYWGKEQVSFDPWELCHPQLNKSP